MAVYLARSCPMCRNYLGVVIGEPKSEKNVRPIRGRCSYCGYVVNWTCFQVMAQMAIDKIPPGPKLDALTAEKVFGWRNVHQHDGCLVGKKGDKLGRWRSAKVPNFSTNPLDSYSVEQRMKQLGRSEKYLRELSELTSAKNVPPEWATPDQRCRAAIKAMGQCGRVVPLNRNRKQRSVEK
jgi:hypothetical protein